MHVAEHELAGADAGDVAVGDVAVRGGRGGEAREVGEGAPERELGADAHPVDRRLPDGATDVDDVRDLALGAGGDHREELVGAGAHVAEHPAQDLAVGRFQRVELQLLVELVDGLADGRDDLAAQEAVGDEPRLEEGARHDAAQLAEGALGRQQVGGADGEAAAHQVGERDLLRRVDEVERAVGAVLAGHQVVEAAVPLADGLLVEHAAGEDAAVHHRERLAGVVGDIRGERLAVAAGAAREAHGGVGEQHRRDLAPRVQLAGRLAVEPGRDAGRRKQAHRVELVDARGAARELVAADDAVLHLAVDGRAVLRADVPVRDARHDRRFRPRTGLACDP